MTDTTGPSRRKLLQALGVGGLALLSSPVEASHIQGQDTETDYHAAPTWIGNASQRPDLGSLEDSNGQILYRATDTGELSIGTAGSTGWRRLSQPQQQLQIVTERDDLPAPSNGTHTLEDNTGYLFNGFITSPYGLELGTSTPLLGRHGSLDGFIHTGGGTAITASNSGFFARDVYVHAPAGTIFDLSGDQSTEMLVESCSFSNAAGIANIANLGTIDGYRVPSFKGCNFEDFDSGLTFDGTPDKIFFSETPFRGVTASNVTVITMASTLDVDIVDMTDNYVKGVQSDTEVVHVETGGTPNDIFQYRGTTHDSSVTVSNILTGEAGADQVGYRVTDSYPISDSAVTGELDVTSTTTITGSGSSRTQITAPTTIQNAERTSMPSDGVLQYDGKDTVKTIVHINIAISGANTEFAVYIGVNGSPVLRSRALGFLPNNSNPVGAVALAEFKLNTGDKISAYLENTGGSADLDVEEMALTV